MDSDTLTAAEQAELRDLIDEYKSACRLYDRPMADMLCIELKDWGAWPPERGWCASCESKQHQQLRLELRSASRSSTTEASDERTDKVA